MFRIVYSVQKQNKVNVEVFPVEPVCGVLCDLLVQTHNAGTKQREWVLCLPFSVIHTLRQNIVCSVDLSDKMLLSLLPRNGKQTMCDMFYVI